MDSRSDERREQRIPDETKTSSSVIDKLFQAGYRFDFFQAVYLLEKLYQKAARPGEEGPLDQEPIRFRANYKRAFPGSEVSQITRQKSDHAQRVTQRPEIVQLVLSFMGLYGVDSPLPPCFAELIAGLGKKDEEMDDDASEDGVKALRQFLDIFDHRLYSLFYRSWKKYRYHLQFRPGAQDGFSQSMLSLLGLGTSALQEAVGVSSARLIAYSGIIGHRSHCAVGLQGLISDYFGGIVVKIIEFMPRWVNVPEKYRPRLGGGSKGVRAQLGENFTIGGKIRDLNGKFRIILALEDLESFRGFLPGGANSEELYKLVRFYAPDQLSFDVELLLKKEEVPPLQLGASPAQLGWTSWLRKPHEDEVSVVFSFGEA
jgi:type VI secretion system protein ImpH